MVEEEIGLKQWLPTILLVVVCIAGFWYVNANDFFVADEEGKGTNELVELVNENLTDISVETQANQLKLVNKNNKWQISGKSGLEVNQSNVDGWISTVMLMVYSDVVIEKAKNLKEYGLSSAKAKFVIERKGAKKIVIEVGDELPTRDFYYVKVSGSDTVYKVNKIDIDQLDKGEIDFIDKQLVDFQVDQVVKLELDWRTHRFILEKVADKAKGTTKWLINEKKELTQTEAENILYELKQWNTNQASKPFSEFDTSIPDLKINLTIEKDGNRTTREWIGVIGTELVWVGEKGTKWMKSILGDTINSYALKNKNK